MTLRKTTPMEKKVFTYLNELRESGATNMFGARPYIMQKFRMESSKAKIYLTTWMKVFNADGNYDEIETR